jgi:outer membrane protein assembly factor BamB
MLVPLNVWSQFGANPAGSGCRLVNTTAASAPGWAVNLPGPTDTSSPVLGPDGTIYIGTANGWLVALHPGYQPTGQIKWAIHLPSQDLAASEFYAVQTPAVADDGTIYCICTPGAVIRDHRGDAAPRALPSYLASVSPSGTLRWMTSPPVLSDLLGKVQGVLNGAPRLLSLPQPAGGSGAGLAGGRAVARAAGPGPLLSGDPVNEHTRIIAIVRYTLVLPDPTLGPDSRNTKHVSQLMIVTDTTFGSKRPVPVADIDTADYEEQFDFVDAHGGGGVDGTPTLTESGPSDLPAGAFPCADTPVVFGSLPATGSWAIIASGNEGLYAMGWNSTLFPGYPGQLTAGPRLLPLQTVAPALTAAFANGLVAGFMPDKATLIDSDTFTTLAEASLVPSSGVPIGGQATVAGGGRQMYFLNRFGHLFAVDPNGSHWRERDLNHGSVAFPALSGNHLHVATTAGLHTLTLDLQDAAFFPLDGAGFSSPAIGPDGAVYVAAGPFLYAFSDALPSLGGGFRGL